MINIEILKEDCLQLPLEYDTDSCEEAIGKRLSEYESVLKKYNVDDSIINLVSVFRSNINEMYTEYYLGHQNRAYQAFKKTLLKQLTGINLITSLLPKESLYRARKNEGNRDYKNNEMFHIKYNLRGKVQTQRFSFPGLPCLYLGGSAYVCWLELNRPQFDQFQVATIRQKNESNTYKVIDLCIHPLTYYKEIMKNNKNSCDKINMMDLVHYLQWWPIMAVCSVAVKNENDSFKPEYVFPQFMLQYLLEEMQGDECIGIKYISIKAGKISKRQYESDYRTYTNYVIPIRTATKNDKGFCEFLDKEFCVVRNYSGRELQVLTDSIRDTGVEWVDFGDETTTEISEEKKLFGTNDVTYLYSKSIFGRIETILENKDLDKYNADGRLIISPISEEDINRMFEDVN